MTKLSGCDCDESLPNADSFCGANEKCKNCKCLKKGWLIFYYFGFSIFKEKDATVMILFQMRMISVQLTRNARIASVFLQVMSALSMVSGSWGLITTKTRN